MKSALVLLIAMLSTSSAFAAEDQAAASTSTTAASTNAGGIQPVAFSDYHVRLEETQSRFNLGFYGQASQFTFEGRSLLGNALELDAVYALDSRWAANVSIAQAITIQGGLGLLYTGLRGALEYAFRGSFIKRESTVIINGQRSLETKTGEANLIAANVGADQFMFNGTNRVVPASGFSFGGRYDRNFGQWRASFIARYGMLLVSSQTSSMMTFGAGLVYGF